MTPDDIQIMGELLVEALVQSGMPEEEAQTYISFRLDDYISRYRAINSPYGDSVEGMCQWMGLEFVHWH